jgi:hypothetical protein
MTNIRCAAVKTKTMADFLSLFHWRAFWCIMKKWLFAILFVAVVVSNPFLLYGAWHNNIYLFSGGCGCGRTGIPHKKKIQ